MKPWREVASPHADVLEGTFQQSEFAADITAVRDGKATREYQNATAFFERTFITEGMRLLLLQVALRLNGKGGEPVIQLQTAFGGGKTHTMLAVYHLASRETALNDLPGIPAILDQSGMMDIPKAKVAILDGTAHSPGQPWKRDSQTVKTLWGELAWQLGGLEAYEKVALSDENGTSPGKDLLRELLSEYAPCVVLIDELVAYVRQFGEGMNLSGGSYNANISFAQALTEAAKLVPNAVVLASLPESEIEAGDKQGVAALKALEKTFGRIQALWKPVASEEAFEIVRRRLFEPISDLGARDEVCRAFADLYRNEGVKMPSETHESRYTERLSRAYPFHPEVFDRLYEDWTTLEAFQRTRGVLKLMARVIFRLWKDDNKDLMITPGAIPLYDGHSRNELTYYLGPGWDPVIEKDIDGERAEASELDTKESRFGALNAAKRVGRTVFLGTAPSSVATTKVNRGIDRARILLGCMQPGQTSSLFDDALNRLADKLHYLNSSGDKADSSTRFWFDTRANLRREMEDRKGRFDERSEVRKKIYSLLSKIAVGDTLFDAVHIFTAHADIPDDSLLRLVILDVSQTFGKNNPVPQGIEAVKEYVQKNGTKPRFKGNRLIFAAPDSSTLGRMTDSVRTALAWKSIVDDVAAHRLNIDRLQEEQAKKETETAEAVALRSVRDCFKWLLCPCMHSSSEREIAVETYPVNTTGPSFATELDRVCTENELVITAWSPVHLKNILQELYWKQDRKTVRGVAVWEDMQKYLYLPRLKSRTVLEKAILQGGGAKEFFGTAVGEDSSGYMGFKFGISPVQLDDTLLLIEPAAATDFDEKLKKEETQKNIYNKLGDGKSVLIPKDLADKTNIEEASFIEENKADTLSFDNINKTAKKAKTHFFGAVEINAAAAKMKMITIAEEVINLLVSDPEASVKVTIEIDAEFPRGASDNIERAVVENAKQLGFKSGDWE